MQFSLPPILLPLLRNLSEHLGHKKSFCLLQQHREIPEVHCSFVHHQIGGCTVTDTIPLPSRNSSGDAEQPLDRATRCRDGQRISRYLCQIWKRSMIRPPPTEHRFDTGVVRGQCWVPHVYNLSALGFSLTGQMRSWRWRYGVTCSPPRYNLQKFQRMAVVSGEGVERRS